MNLRRSLTALLVAAAAAPAFAGPPYLTDDPEPTDFDHWEIYTFTAIDGYRSDFDGDAGLDLNFGAAKDLQLTATVPLSFSNEEGDGWKAGRGNLELGVKYRFIDNEAHGFSAAVFPRAILPTASHSPGEKTRLLLPLWAQQDLAGGSSIFGGGGYMINPGHGNRNFWQAAVAVTHDVSKVVSVGAEIAWQEAEMADGTSQTSAGLGTVVRLSDRHGLFLSGGPTWADRRTGYHLYAALGTNF